MKLVKFRVIKGPYVLFSFSFFSFFFFPFSSIFYFVCLPFDRSWSFNRAGTWTGRLDLRVWISCVCDVHVCMGVYWGSAGVWSGNVSNCRGRIFRGSVGARSGNVACWRRWILFSPVLLSIYVDHVAAWCCFASDYTSRSVAVRVLWMTLHPDRLSVFFFMSACCTSICIWGV